MKVFGELFVVFLAMGKVGGFVVVAPPALEFPTIPSFKAKVVNVAGTTVVADAVPVSGGTTFLQLIDHNNPAFGTFQQRYWYNTEFWNGTGSPVVLFSAGEGPVIGTNFDLTGYLGIETLVGQYAQAMGAATVMVEHRYWGESTPYTNLTADNLQYLTVPQSIADLTYFANNAALPFDLSGNSNPDKAPWILMGGSYAGDLVAWTALTSPGTFWAYHASSAPVQAIDDYWQYFYPIQQGMPQDCRISLLSIIAQVDAILTTGTTAQKNALKSTFGLGLVSHDDDFANTIASPLGLWQEGIDSFLPFCNTLAGSGGNVISLNTTIPNYGRYINSHYACTSLDCYDTYNAASPEYKTTSINKSESGGRQWQWMLCHEGFNWWQTGAPVGQDTIVSRLVTAKYFQQQCGFYFPGVQFSRTVDQQNSEYSGWNIQGTRRLLFSNGEFDPWRSASVSSEFRPGGPMASTSDLPIFIVPNGTHMQDIYMNDPTPEVLALRAQQITQMMSWVNDFSHPHPNNTSTSLASSSTGLSSSESTKQITTTSTAPPIPSSSSTSISTSISSSIPTSFSIPTSISFIDVTRITLAISTVSAARSTAITTTALASNYTTSTKYKTDIRTTRTCKHWWGPCYRATITQTVPVYTTTKLVSTPQVTRSLMTA